MRRNSRISKRVTQLASRLRMQPTVIGLPDKPVLGPGPIPNRSFELLGFNR